MKEIVKTSIFEEFRIVGVVFGQKTLHDKSTSKIDQSPPNEEVGEEFGNGVRWFELEALKA